MAFSDAFHGRTFGALAATPREKYQAPFRPLLPGVRIAPFNDLDGAAAIMGDDVCAVIVEPVQGEGGVHPGRRRTFLAGLRELCDRHHALLIFDEVQCGLGRTGTLWAYQGYGVTPDHPDGGQTAGRRAADGRRADDPGRGRCDAPGRSRQHVRRVAAGRRAWPRRCWTGSPARLPGRCRGQGRLPEGAAGGDQLAAHHWRCAAAA